jgi:two-component system cell cycle sensor histidine kinase/response regulator CckA
MNAVRTGRRVLAVEDDPNIMHLIVDTLEISGYTVSPARTPEEALQRLRTEKFDGAVVDFMLPGLDGVELHAEIQKIDMELADRTLFISGLLQTKENLDYFLSRGAGYLPKPFRIEDLIESVDRMFESI